MVKISLLLLSIIMASAGFSNCLKLINTRTGKAIIEFQDEETVFHGGFMEWWFKEMKAAIVIPRILIPEYGAQYIYCGHPLFRKAFVEVAWPYEFAYEGCPYKWENLEIGSSLNN